MESVVVVSETVPVSANNRNADLARQSAAAWGAILAGAAAAGALTVILAFLGLGFGMGAISPWRSLGDNAEMLGVGAIAWLALTQIAAAALGGYLAGRLRVRWPGVQTDEVYFRDTAHGFLSWAVATLVVAACMSSVIGGIGRAGAEMAGNTATTAAIAASDDDDGGTGIGGGAVAYTVDVLLRRPAPSTGLVPNVATTSDPTLDPAVDDATIDRAPIVVSRRVTTNTAWRSELTRALTQAVRLDSLTDADAKYLASHLAARNGITTEEAETAVRSAYDRLKVLSTQAKQAADKARKATAWASIWLFISLLAGAFTAALAATWGGRQRDLD